MNKYLSVIPLLFCGCVSASGPYVEYGTQKLEFDRVSTSVQGATIGYSWKEDKKLFVEFDVMNSSDDLTYLDFSGGFNYRLMDSEGLDFFFNMGIGVTYIDYEKFQNTNTLMSLPIGFAGSYTISDNWNAELSVGYRYHIDLTSPTECNDGTESDSVGSGTCSYHGGIKRYQDQIGNGGGVNASLGLRYTY